MGIDKAESPEKIETRRAAAIKRAVSDEAYRAAGAVRGGGDPISGLIATGANLLFVGAGMGMGVAASADENRVSEIEASANRYIATDTVSKMAAGAASIPDWARQSDQFVGTKLATLSQTDPNNPAVYDNFVREFIGVVRGVNHPFVVRDPARKAQLIDEIKRVFETSKRIPITPQYYWHHNDTLKLFTTLYSNPYLLDTTNEEDQNQKKQWYIYLNEVAEKIFDNPVMNKSGFDMKLRGEYLWLQEQLPVPGQGSVTFEVKALSDVFVAFADDPFQAIDGFTNMYEIVIGMWKNKLTTIHRQPLGDPVVEFPHKQYAALKLDPKKFKKYWINLNKGKISIGTGELGQNEICQWQDPYPPGKLNSVGLSNWIGEITVRNVTVGPALEASAQDVAAAEDAAVEKLEAEAESETGASEEIPVAVQVEA